MNAERIGSKASGQAHLLGHHGSASASALLVGVSKKEDSMTLPHDLLDDLRSSPTDLARVVEAVVRDRLPNVIIPVEAVRSWERRAPDHRAKVVTWLTAQNIAVVQV
ncbi:MAG TPA: hypothetical protein VKB81_00965 [Nitrospira sp.]|nr:hypothetical protein [Nitrospira sp.]